MDSLWVLILLLVAISTVVTVRLFVNGAQEEADTTAFETLAPGEAPAAPRARAAARSRAADSAVVAAPETAPAAITTPPPRGRRRAATSPPLPAVWPGGDCPSCGSATVPSAKFCGECGHRLVNG